MSRNFQDWYFERGAEERFGGDIQAAAEGYHDAVLEEADDVLDALKYGDE